MIYERCALSSSGGGLSPIRKWLGETDIKDGDQVSAYERRRRKVRQTLLLMSVMYASYDDSALQKIAEKSNKLIC
jgi:hypothetical protein